jgi:hypothetical protein
VEFIAATEMSGMLASSVDSGFIDRNSLSLHKILARLASA